MAIAQSSAEAELGGAHRAALMAVGVQNTWLELFEENLPIGLLMDSAAGKIMAVRRGKGKVRHLEVKQLYMQELTNALRVKTYKAKGEENKADIGTKPMTARTLEKFYAWLGIEKSESADVIDDKMTDEKQIGTLDSCLLKRLLGTAVFATLLGACKGEGIETQCSEEQPITDPYYSWGLTIVLLYCLLHFVGDIWCMTQYAKTAFTTATPSELVETLLPAEASDPVIAEVPVEVPETLICGLTVTTLVEQDTDSMGQVFVAPRSGECYHRHKTCSGLRSAKEILPKRRCKLCWPGD